MSNIDALLKAESPTSLVEARQNWPTRTYTSSPAEWRDEVFYFLLPDRFSDGGEASRRMLPGDMTTPAGAAALAAVRGANWSWRDWAVSGATRFQGGTLKGVESKLQYLKDLGVSAVWLAPVFRQRVEENDYHGYGIQNFLDIDPRFGTRADLISLVDRAHSMGIRVILDVIFNHTGCNFLYDRRAGDEYRPRFIGQQSYDPIWSRSGLGSAILPPNAPNGPDDYVYPTELRGPERYLRAGCGDLGKGDVSDDNAEHKRTDFLSLRKLNLWSDALDGLLWIYHYWMALADIDGFRIDTLKHVTFQQARDFCNGIAEYAESIGKDNFFLVAEVAGSDDAQQKYLQVTGRNLSACLDIDKQLKAICGVAKGLGDPKDFFDGYSFADGMGSKRNWGSLHMSISNDHDHVSAEKIRLAADAPNDHRAIVAIALQMFGLGIPCLYYGMEQNLASGMPASERQWLPSGPNGGSSKDGWQWGKADFLLRETMFGAERPRASGYAGATGARDASLVGFGPHGTTGHHAFNPQHPMYQRIQQLAAARRKYKPLRRGRQYRRETSANGNAFGFSGAGEILAWSRVFDDQEVLVVVNANGVQAKSARVVVDHRLSYDSRLPSGMKVVCNTDPTSQLAVGTIVSFAQAGSITFIDVPTLGPSEVLVLVSRSAQEAAGLQW